MSLKTKRKHLFPAPPDEKEWRSRVARMHRRGGVKYDWRRRGNTSEWENSVWREIQRIFAEISTYVWPSLAPNMHWDEKFTAAPVTGEIRVHVSPGRCGRAHINRIPRRLKTNTPIQITAEPRKYCNLCKCVASKWFIGTAKNGQNTRRCMTDAVFRLPRWLFDAHLGSV